MLGNQNKKKKFGGSSYITNRHALNNEWIWLNIRQNELKIWIMNFIETTWAQDIEYNEFLKKT